MKNIGNRCDNSEGKLVIFNMKNTHIMVKKKQNSSYCRRPLLKKILLVLVLLKYLFAPFDILFLKINNIVNFYEHPKICIEEALPVN